MVNYLVADAVCLTCGSTKQDPITAFCINDHDNWLEIDDTIELFSYAVDRFNLPVSDIVDSIRNNKDIVILKNEH
jgi:hypothetical protein